VSSSDSVEEPTATTSYGSDTRWSFAIFLTRSVASLVFVLATSRALGSSAYGSLAALSAATSMAAVLTTSGIAHAATMFASRSTDGGGRMLASGLRAGAATAVVVTVGFLILATTFDNVTVLAAAALFAADVLVAGFAEVVASILIGLHRFRSAAAIWITYAVGRAGAAAAIVLLDDVSLERATTLAGIGSLATIPVALLAARAVTRERGPDISPTELVKTGGIFTAGNLVARLNNDFDKLLLTSRLGSVSSVGTYAVGYRLVEYSLLPLTALSSAAYPRMFRAGERGGQAARALARRLATFYIGTGIILAVALFAVRGLTERLFGESYGELSTVITMLLGLPVLRATINLLGEPLTGSGNHRRRVLVTVAAMLVNVAVNLALLDRIGWRAAVWATYASEITQVLLLAALTIRMQRQDRNAAAVNTLK
jgi:O-antigen/teichoic acid export membrane protein